MLDRQTLQQEPTVNAAAAEAVLPPLSAARWLLLLLVGAGIYFFHGFLVPVLASVVIGFASWPLYNRILHSVHGNRTAGATIATLLVVGLLVVPVMFVAVYASYEAATWVEWLIRTNQTGAPTPAWMAALPVVGEWIDGRWTEYIGSPGSMSRLLALADGADIGSIYSALVTASGSVIHVALTLIFMLITLFFVYRDGERLTGQVNVIGERILPTRWGRFSRVVPTTISSTVTGMTLIAIGEGIVLGVAYWIAGVPSPAALGVITGVMALIPGGAPLAFTLVSLYLVARGTWIAGLLLFAWGSIELFIVDKTLRPKLVGGPIKLPFLPTFFGLIGGVKTMGFLGLFVGPVLMALLVAIWREWVADGRSGVTNPKP